MLEGEQPLARTRSVAWGRVWQVPALIFALYMVEQGVEAVLYATHNQPGAGTLGLLDQAHDGGFAPGYVVVNQIEPDTPLARAGVSAGDHLRFDRTGDYMRTLRVGETIGLTIDHGGRRVHRVLTAVPWLAKPQNQATATYLICQGLSVLVTALFAAFILWRSGGRRAALLLGSALACFGVASLDSGGLWESDPRLWLFLVAFVNSPVCGLVFPLFVGFAMSYAERPLSRRPRWQWSLLGAYTAVCVAFTVVWFWTQILVVNLPGGLNPTVVFLLIGYPGCAATLWLLFQGWRRSDRSARSRYALLLVAFSAIVVAELIMNFGVFLKLPYLSPVFLGVWLLSGLVAPVLFAYAILRHRVLDLGFAINRTLVYATVSAILLAAFGLIEWAVDHFVPIEGREKNALVDAVIAVGVFLTFHRVRDVVERVVERLFFQSWQRAEADLRRFVREAAFITEAPALTLAFAEALKQFSEGAHTAVYRREGLGYERAAGEVDGVGDRLEANLPALVSVRADLKAMEVQAGVLAGALISPMLNRNEVIGVAVLGAKPSGRGWRPDEIELIDWATRQVGLDLHALTVEQLENERSELRVELRSANAQLDRLLGLSATRA